ncbi:arsenate reductase (glutaredoxin) [Cognatilysobacter segetis]|uniref:arsenate reductase (glutaredoxin) n=1 Tax=Cognatilysobacter segetis TaxID=2492394 RepID=UPI0010620B9B|nr:arsenate reductase (glutaredoxin) [Lysobacter segetis]
MSSERPVLFHNKASCSKCSGALALLRERGIEPELVDITLTPLSASRLREIAAMTGGPVRSLLRTGEAAYERLGLADPSLDDDALVEAMAAHPELVERPLLVHGGRAVVGRPPERVLTLFDAC